MDTHGRYLNCKHCNVEFLVTQSQWNHRHERGAPCCSKTCRFAAQKKKVRPELKLGPCPTCGEMFHSKRLKTFCTLKCYTRSDSFIKMVRENYHKGHIAKGISKYGREKRKCLECEIEFETILSKKTKFCCHQHYRQYMSKRFDRKIASVEDIALPQNYDEFLTQEELPCLVQGCGWRGGWLTLHMNYSHGVTADEFKRAAGFNLGSGIVSPATAESLRARENVGVALKHVRDLKLLENRFKPNEHPEYRRYKSLEGREHRIKSRFLLSETSGAPVRVCEGCKKEFKQSTVFGFTKYCNTKCRDGAYLKEKQKKFQALQCGFCKKEFLGNKYQDTAARKGKLVVCSIKCRNKLNFSKTKNHTKHRQRHECLSTFLNHPQSE